MLSKDPEIRISASDARYESFFSFDQEDNSLIKEGLKSCLNFIKFGKVQSCFLKMFIEKLSTDKMKRKYMKMFFLMNKDSSGEINMEELYQNFQE